MSSREILARNTLFNAGGRTWDGVVSLVIVAYLVWRLGPADYGLWAIVGSFAGYAALFDVGLGAGYSKFIAEHHARKDTDAVSRVVSTGLTFYLLFGAVFLGVLWPLSGWVVGVFTSLGPERIGDLGDPETAAELLWLVRGTLIIIIATMCAAPFSAVQAGVQRMGVTNAIGIVMATLKLVLIVGLCEAGYGLRGVIYAHLIVTACFAVISVVVAFRLMPGLRVGPSRVTGETWRALFGYGWKTQVSRLANLVMFETDVLVIALVLGQLELAGIYRVAVELVNKVRQVPVVLYTALIPAVSDLDARDEQERLSELYRRVGRYSAVIGIPLFMFAATAAPVLMAAWQGSAIDTALAAGVVQVLAAGYLANVLAGAQVSLALGRGRPELQMISGLISMSLNLALTVTLVYTIGFWGIPIATSISMLVSWVWVERSVARLMHERPGAMAAGLLRGPLFAALPGGLFVLGCWYVTPAMEGRLPHLIAAAAMLAFFCVLYLTMLRRGRILDARDAEFFGGTLGLRRVPGFKAWARPLFDVVPGADGS